MERKRLEEVPVKLMDRNATEMERRRASEMDKEAFIHFSGIFICVALFQSIHFRGMSSFHFCGTWSVHPFHRHFLYN